MSVLKLYKRMLSIARSKLKVLCNNISFVSRSVKANYFIQTQVEHPTLLDYFILVYLFIGGWWREDFAWWRVRWWRDRSLVASSLVASLPGGEVTGNRLHDDAVNKITSFTSRH